MNHFDRFSRQFSGYVFIAIVLLPISGLGTYIVTREMLAFEPVWAALAACTVLLLGTVVAYLTLVKAATKPLGMLWQAIWHVSPDRSDVPPPNMEDIRLGRELVTTLVGQVYELASSRQVAAPAATAASAEPSPRPQNADSGIIDNIPSPLFLLDKKWTVRAANAAACRYLGREREALLGKSINDVLHLSFSSNDTLDQWLQTVSADKATDVRTWEHVRLDLGENTIRQLDLAAGYSRDNSAGNEVILTLFDRTASYSEEDKATSYVAMAVHELRTPLTMLRGYIEMFEDELGPTLDPEHQAFMRKMSASSQSLAAFVANILNVARIDGNEFVVSLHEGNWKDVLTEVVHSLELRAEVRGKKLQLNIADDLPTVGIDKISIYEVVGNLVENAIKYGGQSTDIIISSQIDKNGLVETTVQDFGIGIPQNVLGGLFTKFYRSHRSKNVVGGNGLGLYIVKSIVNAHGGNVWVQSKEGEGSTFGFTLQPYARVQAAGITGHEGIEHQAGGWIKNHSLYRR